MNVKKFGAEVAMVGALAFTALGVGGGVASADQSVAPNSPGATWKLDKPKWDDDWDDYDDWRGARWDGPRYGYGGPCVWVPPAVAMWVPPAVC